MSHNSDQRLMVQYLLGELPKHQRKQVEQKFFSDNAFFDRLLEVEDGLINDYVLGRLSEHARLQFERYFLSTAQKRRKVELYMNRQEVEATAEAASIQSRPTAATHSLKATKATTAGWWDALSAFFQGRRLVGQIAVACVALALLISLWVYISNKRKSAQLASTPEANPGISAPAKQTQKTKATPPNVHVNRDPSNEERTMPPDLPANTAPPQRQPRSTTDNSREKQAAPIVATLVPGLTRDNSQIPTIDLSSGAPSLMLKVEIQDDRYESYRAILRKREQGGDDKLIYRWPRGKSQRQNRGASLRLLLPPARLVSGFYYLELYGSLAGREEKVDRYPLEIMNR